MAAQHPGGFTVRRITVALEPSAPGNVALDTAVRLAALLKAELEGLFVEDINMERIAALPVARLVRFTGQSGPVEPDSIRSGLESEARTVEQALRAAAARLRVHASFQRVRGNVVAEVVAAGERSDLLILAHSAGALLAASPVRGLSGGDRPGATALAAAERAARSVLIMRPGADISRSALVLYDGSDGAEKVLSAAAAVAVDRREALTVLLRADSEEEAVALRGRASRLLNALGQPARFEVNSAPTLVGMCRMASQLGAGVLVIGAADPLLGGKGYAELLNEVRCPVLLVR